MKAWPIIAADIAEQRPAACKECVYGDGAANLGSLPMKPYTGEPHGAM
jgi:hypothetical protein